LRLLNILELHKFHFFNELYYLSVYREHPGVMTGSIEQSLKRRNVKSGNYFRDPAVRAAIKKEYDFIPIKVYHNKGGRIEFWKLLYNKLNKFTLFLHLMGKESPFRKAETPVKGGQAIAIKKKIARQVRQDFPVYCKVIKLFLSSPPAMSETKQEHVRNCSQTKIFYCV